MIATFEEGSFQEGNKLEQGGWRPITETPPCVLPVNFMALTKGGGGDLLGSMHPCSFEQAMDFYQVVNLCETWRGEF